MFCSVDRPVVHGEVESLIIASSSGKSGDSVNLVGCSSGSVTHTKHITNENNKLYTAYNRMNRPTSWLNTDACFLLALGASSLTLLVCFFH